MKSDTWRNLRETMPEPRECIACKAKTDLDLHHMFYPKNIFTTKHVHCCWLCRKCHDKYHAKIRGSLPNFHKLWGKHKSRTIRIINKKKKRRDRANHVPSLRPAPQLPRALSNRTGVVVIPPKG